MLILMSARSWGNIPEPAAAPREFVHNPGETYLIFLENPVSLYIYICIYIY